MAESVRGGMAKQWTDGVYDQQKLAEWAKAGDVHKVLSTVPIVSAWNAVMEKSKEGGILVRVPRFEARNSKNLPDKTEAQALHEFAQNPKLEEYVIEDQDENTIRYFRPIKLTQECLICHGDPSTSYALWGNKEGMDATGYKMEGLKEGSCTGRLKSFNRWTNQMLWQVRRFLGAA